MLTPLQSFQAQVASGAELLGPLAQALGSGHYKHIMLCGYKHIMLCQYTHIMSYEYKRILLVREQIPIYQWFTRKRTIGARKDRVDRKSAAKVKRRLVSQLWHNFAKTVRKLLKA